MQVEINDQEKTLFIWMTSKEREDPDTHQQLRPLFQEYKKQKYIVATFESGKQDLYEPFLRMAVQRKLNGS